MENPNTSSTSSSYSTTSEMIPWSEKKEIQKLIHGNYENAQFDAKQQPIPIYKLAQIILSFINGESSPAYIVIGIKEEKEKYDFTIVSTKPNVEKEPDGIYGIISNDKKSIECYQVKNGEIVLLQLNHTSKDLDKSNQYLKKTLSRYDKDKKKLSSEDADKYFINFVGNPINSNYIKHVELPIKIEDKKNQVIYETVESYIEAVKTYIEKNSVSDTVRTINLDRHISHEYIKPYNNEESKIIIIKITPWNSNLIALLFKGDLPAERFYGRTNNPGQRDYGSNPLNAERKSEIEKTRLQNRKSKFSNTISGPSLYFMDLVDYMHEEKIALDIFKEILSKSKDNLICMLDVENNNLLMLAIHYEQEEIIKFLIEKYGISKVITHFNEKGENAFIMACNKKNWSTVKYLLNNLDNLNLTNNKILKLVKETLEDGFSIINSSNDDYTEYKDIKKLIKNQLLKYENLQL